MNKLIDYLSLPLCLWIGSLLRFHTVWFGLREYYLLFSGFLAWTAAASILRIYSNEINASSPYRRVTTIITFFFIMTGLSFYAHNELDFSRVVLVTFSLLQLTFPLVLRGGINHFFPRQMHKNRYSSLLIGSGPFFHTIEREYQLKENSFRSLEIVEADHRTFLERLDLSEVHEILLATSHIDKSLNNQVLALAQSAGVRCQIILPNELFTHTVVKAETFGDRTHFRPLINRLELYENRVAKRLFDIVGSSLIILLISPLLVVVSLIVKATNPRETVLFRQKRTGYNQKTFECFKFRSMISSPDADTMQAVIGYSRITPFGKWIRRTSIDELPQLFNVLRGDMSLIGPRPHPHLMEQSAGFQEIAPEYLLRHFVSPGITGWAQVNGWRGPTDTEEKLRKRVECDLWYVENWSIWLDCKILVLTLFSRKTWDGAF